MALRWTAFEDKFPSKSGHYYMHNPKAGSIRLVEIDNDDDFDFILTQVYWSNNRFYKWKYWYGPVKIPKPPRD